MVLSYSPQFFKGNKSANSPDLPQDSIISGGIPPIVVDFEAFDDGLGDTGIILFNDGFGDSGKILVVEVSP